VKSLLRILLAVLLAAAPLACAKRETAGPEKASAPSANAKRYDLRGVIRAVDAGKREVTVEHEKIPGYMDAMTMKFPVRDDPQVFEILRPGDRLEAKLVVDEEDYWIESVLTKGFVPTSASGTPFSRTCTARTPPPGTASNGRRRARPCWRTSTTDRQSARACSPQVARPR